MLAADPQIHSFDGSTYQFDGSSGAYYDAVSDKDYRVSLRLKPGVMYDHNGTYLDALGVKVYEHTVVVSIGADDSLEGVPTVGYPRTAFARHAQLAGKLLILSTSICRLSNSMLPRSGCKQRDSENASRGQRVAQGAGSRQASRGHLLALIRAWTRQHHHCQYWCACMCVVKTSVEHS